MSLIVPAEWSDHSAMWLGFPSHGELWLEDLEPAQKEVADLARALAGPGGERVRLMVCGDEAEADMEQVIRVYDTGGHAILYSEIASQECFLAKI